MPAVPPPDPAPLETRHTLAEDIYAILIGASLSAYGIVMLHAAGLVTGGVAGIALTVSYLTGIPVGTLFFVINLPFLILAQRTMGWLFAIKSAATVALLSLLTVVIPRLSPMTQVDPWFAAIFGGTMIGMGILSLARHKSSVGGVGVLALYLYETRGINAGKVQGAADTLIVLSAFVAIDTRHLLLSVISAIALSLVLYTFHKKGRYTGH
jgi:uncharacterized membrane-anchored protein YitT (DUF2179 family)